MPVISGAISVGANARSGNILAGEVFEFMPSPGLVNFLLTQAVIGLQADILVGGSAEALAAVLPIRAAANPFPVKPDDSIVIAGANGGDRLFVDLLNTTGAAIIAQFLIEIGT